MHREHSENWRVYDSKRPQSTYSQPDECLLDYCFPLSVPYDDQYRISGGSFGLGRSVSGTLALKVNRSTSENTLVWRVALGAAAVDYADVMEDQAVADEIAQKKLVGAFGGTDGREAPG